MCRRLVEQAGRQLCVLFRYGDDNGYGGASSEYGSRAAGGAAVGGVPGALVGGALGLASSLIGGLFGKSNTNKTNKLNYQIMQEQNKFKGEETNETYTLRDGRKIALPIYYRNKIYTEEEKEKLWLIKLDKEERWICGERIDISDNLDDYYKTRNYYRDWETDRKSTRLNSSHSAKSRMPSSA